ncbi:hypothetical protein [Flavobacterium sp. JP2137]|uniref:hypothetical protein n=1 Tax=Flavobacterium sp. JP2137 TaxID=3414510 RepID=UPI003D2FABBD
MANKRCFSFFKKCNSLEELKGFTGIEVYFEKDSKVKLVHKETDSECVYESGNSKSTESLIIEFYCFVKRLSVNDFLEFRISKEEKTKNKVEFIKPTETPMLSCIKPENPSEFSFYFDQIEKKVKVFIGKEWVDYSVDVFSKLKHAVSSSVEAPQIFHFREHNDFEGLKAFTESKAHIKDGQYYLYIHAGMVPINLGDYVAKTISTGELSLFLGNNNSNSTPKDPVNYSEDVFNKPKHTISSLSAATASSIFMTPKAIYERHEYIKKQLELDNPKPIRSQAEIDDERLTEIVETIVEYSKSKMAIPPDWIKEYNEILERVNNKTSIADTFVKDYLLSDKPLLNLKIVPVQFDVTPPKLY